MTEEGCTEQWHLELYIAGNNRQSRYALANLRNLCKNHLNEQCHIRVFDLCKNPELAVEHNLYSVPALVKKGPGQAKMLVGDLSNMEKVLIGLELKSRPLKTESLYRSPVPQNRV